MLKFIREEKFEVLENGEDSFDEKPSHIFSTVVAEGFMGYDTIIGYIVKGEDGKFQRRWEWWLW